MFPWRLWAISQAALTRPLTRPWSQDCLRERNKKQTKEVQYTGVLWNYRAVTLLTALSSSDCRGLCFIIEGQFRHRSKESKHAFVVISVLSELLIRKLKKSFLLTNRQQFSIVSVLLSIVDVVLTWNHEPRGSGSTWVLNILTSFCMVDKSTDHGKLLPICFYNNIDSRYPFPFKFLVKSRAREKKQGKKPNWPTITSFPRSVSNIALHQSVREKSLICFKKNKTIFWAASFPGSICFPSL